MCPNKLPPHQLSQPPHLGKYKVYKPLQDRIRMVYVCSQIVTRLLPKRVQFIWCYISFHCYKIHTERERDRERELRFIFVQWPFEETDGLDCETSQRLTEREWERVSLINFSISIKITSSYFGIYKTINFIAYSKKWFKSDFPLKC